MTGLNLNTNKGGDFAKSTIADLIETPKDAMSRKKGQLGLFHKNKNLTFPGDLSTHFMCFMIERYQHNEVAEQTTTHHRNIFLPVPSNLVEQINTQYNEIELGALGGEISDLIAGADITGVKNRVSDYFSGAMEMGANMVTEEGRSHLLSQLKDKGNALTNSVTLGLRKKSNPIGVGLNRFFGSAPNPHITAMFKGVGLRTHNFTWKLSAASAKESITLANIVQQFRQSMLPERTAKNLALGFPDEFKIYIGGGTDSSYMYQFKKAVLRNASINYAPDGQPSFFAGTGAPTAISLTLDFLETKIHTRRDYLDEIE